MTFFTKIGSVYFCPHCKGMNLNLSPIGFAQYNRIGVTNKYYCDDCGVYFKIDMEKEDFD